MADAILGENNAVCNAHSTTIPNCLAPSETRLDLPGLINDPLIDPDYQVNILSLVDEKGSAPLGDLATQLAKEHIKPVTAVLTLVRLGILSVSPGIIDGQSIVTRSAGTLEREYNEATDARPRRAKAQDPDLGVDLLDPERSYGTHGLTRISPPNSRAAIFCAAWSERGMFRSQPLLNRPGIYMALYANAAYIGSSRSLKKRLVNSNHLLDYGWPDLVIAAVDRQDMMSEDLARTSERVLARAVESHGVLRLANRILPQGGEVDEECFGAARGFVREVIAAARAAGLAFMPAHKGQDNGGPNTTPPASVVGGMGFNKSSGSFTDEDAEGQLYSLESCGLQAMAQLEQGRFVLKAGSRVRAEVLRSAGNGPLRQRQELLHDGSLVTAGRHLLLTRDLPFNAASTAARFVVGCAHRGSIWRKVGQSGPALTPELAAPRR